jgi:poly(3-hydroxybutyrate) depolymerase
MIIAPYGTWKSPVDPVALFERPSAPQHPVARGDRYFWVEARASEGGRTVLIRQEMDGSETCITPDGYSIRTRVHEYGGRCFVLANDSVYFSNDQDARLYVQSLEPGATPRPLTVDTEKTTWFADLVISPGERHLFAVTETSRADSENENRLVAVSLAGHSPVEPVVVATGADFYACPVIDNMNGRLSWIEWNHPDMPWDRTRLMTAMIEENGDSIAIGVVRDITGDIDGSICQPRYYAGELVFAADRSSVADNCDDYWNLYRHTARGSVRMTCDQSEYGAPHWVFGEANHAPLRANFLIASRTTPEGDQLVEIDLAGGRQRRVDCAYASFSQLNTGIEQGEVLLLAASGTESPRLVSYCDGAFTTIKSQSPAISASEISTASPVSYPTRGGGVAHAYYYVPRNSKYSAPDDQLPPLLVMVHGGPTSRTSPALDLMRQYWTGSGFAVLDVNHRGSTGYGRRYRQHLLGRWGRVDVDDIIDGIDYLVNQSLVDSERVFIRGKSAGGYAVLRALTEYPEYFRAGACYYGIGNLCTLASITHKFEARYTDRLIGEEFDPSRSSREDSEYYKRSPVNYMHRLRSPMILFQGLEDRVVPPRVSREVVAMLSERGIEYEYVEYSGEGHGFRSSKTNIDAIEKETRFYQRFLGTEC